MASNTPTLEDRVRALEDGQAALRTAIGKLQGKVTMAALIGGGLVDALFRAIAYLG